MDREGQREHVVVAPGAREGRDRAPAVRLRSPHGHRGAELVPHLLDAVRRDDELATRAGEPVVHVAEAAGVRDVLDHARRARAPGEGRARDVPVARVRPLREGGYVRDRGPEAHPHEPVPLLAGVEDEPRAPVGRHALGELRYAHARAGRVVGPAVVRADDAAARVDPSERERGAAVRASVRRRDGMAARVAPQHDPLAEQRRRRRTAAEPRGPRDRVPVVAERVAAACGLGRGRAVEASSVRSQRTVARAGTRAAPAGDGAKRALTRRSSRGCRFTSVNSLRATAPHRRRRTEARGSRGDGGPAARPGRRRRRPPTRGAHGCSTRRYPAPRTVFSIGSRPGRLSFRRR